MPRGKARGETLYGFRQVQRQARTLMMKLHGEIRAREADLKRLKEQAVALGTLTGGVGVQRSSASPAGRINWRAVLGQLPKQFKASHIRSVRGLKSKRPSEIFAAITRWIDAGLVKRKSRGLYERV